VNVKNENKNNKDRFFFHDLINQTHGISLYLEEKHSLDNTEISALKNEIKILESLIQNHFGFKHKNLEPNILHETYEKQSQSIQEAILKFSKIFHLKFKIQLDLNCLQEEVRMIEKVPLYRILNNLIKNIAEAKATQADFLFEFRIDGLNITTVNKIVDQKTTSMPNEGLGLLSMAALADEAGGFYQYEIHENDWVNLVYLPYKNSTSIKKIAA
jgi:signal transduction histidine kinase